MFAPLSITLGEDGPRPHLTIEVLGYTHPDTAEPADLDLMRCRVAAHAPPVEALFEMSVPLWELFELRDYLRDIAGANGPSKTISLAGGLLSLSFAPSRRGPVLCAALLKSIEAAHARLEFLITLEPADIARAAFVFSQLQAITQ